MMPRILIFLIVLILFTHAAVLRAQTFTMVDVGFEVCHVPAAAWADIDNDGDLDAFFTGLNETSVAEAHLFRNDGNDIFVPLSVSINGVSSAACAFGDMDNDGLADLAVSGISGTTTTTIIYKNEGGGVFTDIGAGLVGLSDGSL
ncbi:MAG: VCBS repeat-containing protein, partial [Bacteroidales bacterium]|nr:VCBS repeat-containing protein [Bacteroidales bacterium]